LQAIPVSFHINAISGDGTAQIIWRCVLDPQRDSHALGNHLTEITIPPGTLSLQLETDSPRNEYSTQPFWSQVSLH